MAEHGSHGLSWLASALQSSHMARMGWTAPTPGDETSGTARARGPGTFMPAKLIHAGGTPRYAARRRACRDRAYPAVCCSQCCPWCLPPLATTELTLQQRLALLHFAGMPRCAASAAGRTSAAPRRPARRFATHRDRRSTHAAVQTGACRAATLCSVPCLRLYRDAVAHSRRGRARSKRRGGAGDVPGPRCLCPSCTPQSAGTCSATARRVSNHTCRNLLQAHSKNVGGLVRQSRGWCSPTGVAGRPGFGSASALQGRRRQGAAP
jgi:hypothetical protein